MEEQLSGEKPMEYQEQLKEIALSAAKYMKSYFDGDLPPESVDRTKLNHAGQAMQRYHKLLETYNGRDHLNYLIAQSISEDREELKRHLKKQDLLPEK
jgi:hypothetical protein